MRPIRVSMSDDCQQVSLAADADYLPRAPRALRWRRVFSACSYLVLLLLSACGGGPATEATDPPPVPTVTLSSSATSVTTGQSATLTWSSTNATACTASGAWSGSMTLAGTESTGALSQA